MNWEIGIDMYSLTCIKLMTNKKKKIAQRTYKTNKQKKRKCTGEQGKI